MGKMIGATEKKNGLYVLNRRTLLPILACTSQSQPLHAEIWFHHYRLGHPPFSLLKTMFPQLFQQVDLSTLHCDVCEISKHHQVSYPISNTRSSHPFALVHSDV